MMVTDGMYKMMWEVLYKALDAMEVSAVDNDKGNETACYTRVIELMGNLSPEWIEHGGITPVDAVSKIESLIERDIERYKEFAYDPCIQTRLQSNGAISALEGLLCEIDDELYGYPW